MNCYDLYSCLRTIHGRCGRFSYGKKQAGVFWRGLKRHIGGGELVELQISKTGVGALAGDDAANAFGADIAAQVFLGFFGGGFGAAAQDEAARATVLGVERQHGMARGAAARKKIQHGVAGAGGLLQQALNERQGLGVVESPVTKNLRYLARTFLVGGRYQAVFCFVVFGFKLRHDPAR